MGLKTENISSNVLSIIILLAFGVTLWWTPDYFQPKTYMNLGDSIFPFRPEKFLADYFYIWHESSNDALGSSEGYHSGIIILYYWLLVKLQLIGIPLWAINRLFFLIPIWFFLISSYYFILSFIKGRFKNGTAVLCSIFLVTAPPQSVIAPRPTLALAGFVLAFASIQRYLDTRKVYHLLIFGVACLCMTSMPRYAYLVLFFAPAYVFIWIILNWRTHQTLKILDFLKATGLIFIITVGLNAYTILPTFSFLLNHSSSEFLPSEELYNSRIDTVDVYSEKTKSVYTLRLFVQNISIHALYFSNPILNLISFLIPLLLGVGIIVGRKNKSSLAMGILFILTTSLSICFGTTFYRWLYNNIPGFWILNNPHYIQGAASLPLSVLLAFSISKSWNFLCRKPEYSRLSATYCCPVIFGFILVINNGAYIFDWVPKNRPVFVNGTPTNQAMGNHLPFFKIPDEYWQVESLLGDRNKARILVFPFLETGYMRYSWYPVAVMPEILSAITPLRIGGISAHQTPTVKRIQNYIETSQGEKLHATLIQYNYEFIFIHKDGLPSVNYRSREQYQTATRFLKSLDFLKLLSENEHFIIYEIVKKQ